MVQEIKDDIEQYTRYREESLDAIRKFLTDLNESEWFEAENKAAEPEEENSAKGKGYKKAKELKDEIESVLANSTMEDKDIIAVARRIENSYSTLGVYFGSKWYVSYFKEYVSKVRKTEKTILKPKGFTIESDLSTVLETYNLDKEVIQKKAELYKNDNNSERWGSLRKEIEEKKSALQVEGRTANDRAGEFAKLNYLLAYKAEDIQSSEPRMLPSSESRSVDMDDLELEALALEVELELLSI